jgi:hypothetical protein
LLKEYTKDSAVFIGDILKDVDVSKNIKWFTKCIGKKTKIITNIDAKGRLLS